MRSPVHRAQFAFIASPSFWLTVDGQNRVAFTNATTQRALDTRIFTREPPNRTIVIDL
jgi:hypothetical protein